MRLPFAILVSLTCLAGCSSNDANPTMTLLRAGDAKVCVASDIEDTLRRLILTEGNAQAAKDYMITFDRSSLERFDKDVGKAHCNAWVKIDSPTGTLVEPTPIDYAISTSAQDPSTFLVSAPTNPLRQQIADDAETRLRIEQRQAGQQAETAALAALVKPGWLMGRWVRANAGSDACTSGPYAEFARKGVFSDTQEEGRWSLSGMAVTITTGSESKRLTITEADMTSFTTEDENGSQSSNRRCTADEIHMYDETEEVGDNPEPQADALPNLTQQ